MGLWAALRLRRFLTPTEREQVVAALAEAGRHTRARIGLTVDERASDDPRARARECFERWNLPESERPTAVMVYVSAVSRSFAVVGGDEIERVAPRAFWEVVNRDLTHHFDEQRYCDGLFKAIAQVALQLQRHFPRLDPAGGPEGPGSRGEDPAADRPAGEGG
jgi:uncharacterized membrane protein